MTDANPAAQAYARLVVFYRKTFKTNDSGPLDVCLATVATSAIPGDPLWAFIVGPPSGIKTECMRPFEAEELPTYSLSTLTPHSLVSGLRGGYSLLPKLDNMTLLTKDFTTVLQMPHDKRDEILADLRDMYDGSYSKAFGTKAGPMHFTSHFNFLAGVTNVLEKYYQVMSVLGQRFLLIRTPKFPEDWDTDGERDITVIRSNFRDRVVSALKAADHRSLPNCPKPAIASIKSYAKEISALRTPVLREGQSRTVAAIPEPEGPARLANQLLKLARGIALVRGQSEVTEKELVLVRRVSRDTVPSMRWSLIKQVLEGKETADSLESSTGLSHPTVERHLEDLRLLNVLDRKKKVDNPLDPYHHFQKLRLSILQG